METFYFVHLKNKLTWTLKRRGFILWTFIDVLWDIQYFSFFHLVRKRINQKAFQRVSMPHRCHVRSADSPNLIHTLGTIALVLCWLPLRKRVPFWIVNVSIRMANMSASFGYVVVVRLQLVYDSIRSIQTNINF